VANGLPDGEVHAVTRYLGKIYAGTKNGMGISADEGQSFSTITTTKIGHNNVLCFLADGEVLWIGTQNGLTKLDSNGRYTTYRREGVFSSIGVQVSDFDIGLKSNVINFIEQ